MPQIPDNSAVRDLNLQPLRFRDESVPDENALMRAALTRAALTRAAMCRFKRCEQIPAKQKQVAAIGLLSRHRSRLTLLQRR
jgi:hypothetical protein